MAKGAADVCGLITFCMCGPKGSLCCFVLSIWGSIMLVRVCVWGGGGRGGGEEEEGVEDRGDMVKRTTKQF